MFDDIGEGDASTGRDSHACRIPVIETAPEYGPRALLWFTGTSGFAELVEDIRQLLFEVIVGIEKVVQVSTEDKIHLGNILVESVLPELSVCIYGGVAKRRGRLRCWIMKAVGRGESSIAPSMATSTGSLERTGKGNGRKVSRQE